MAEGWQNLSPCLPAAVLESAVQRLQTGSRKVFVGAQSEQLLCCCAQPAVSPRSAEQHRSETNKGT